MTTNRCAAIVSFCSLELIFFDKMIETLSPHVSQLIVTICDHLFDGTEEDQNLLEFLYHKYQQVEFVQYRYDKEALYGTESRIPQGHFGWSEHWHNTSRYVGYRQVRDDIDWVLFIDADEIIETWPPLASLSSTVAFRLACYFYFILPTHVATTYPAGPLFVRKKHLSLDTLLAEGERYSLLQHYKRLSERSVRDNYLGKTPLAHHYSFVRHKKELLHKVRAWGHHWERDWSSLVQDYFNNPTPKDFIQGYTYVQAPAFWNPLEKAHNVSYVTSKQIAQEELYRLIHD